MIAFPHSALSRVAATFALAAGLGLAATAPVSAQTETYQPEVGQPGKDVVWVPTAQALVDKMLEMAKATPQDFVVDLGSGDGRTVITAARRGIRAHGIEYNPDLVELSKLRAAEAGVSNLATFERADIFQSDFSKATVVTLFLLQSLNERLRPTLLNMKPGTRVVSNTFTMGDWRADETASVGGANCTSWCTALLWIVPAKVEGVWQLGNQELRLTQSYQMLSGTLGQTAIADARLNGADIVFTAGGVRYAGTIDGKTMKGTRSGSASGNWSATQK